MPHLNDLSYAQDVGAILLLGVLEALLSADNALALAILVRHLPDKDQKKVLSYGLGGALFFRAAGVLLAGYLINLWYFKAIGAGYLFYLGISHLISHAGRHAQEIVAPKPVGFWRTVIQVELTDVIFSIDSILVAVALSRNIYVVYFGGVVGIIAMRFVAMWFVKLLKRFPKLETSAYLAIIWIAAHLSSDVYSSLMHTGNSAPGELIPTWLFWMVMLLIFASGFLAARTTHAKGPPA